jgi:acetyl-CoA carboxylase biotin carboxylase subunit
VFRTLLVANRGAIARRIIRACRELSVRAVAVYSEADREAPHVSDADEAVAIGPAPARASYLNAAAILDAARRVKADAIHPGYGFLSERWEFADACARAGIVFVGPSAEAIRVMGDKTGARSRMAAAGVPVLPGSDAPTGSVAEARAVAEQTGFPVMLKAGAGGGGIGIARAATPAELERAFAVASRRAQAAFGAGALYVERFVEHARHIEVQVVGDGHGEVVHLYERDCSVQRRHQKLIEEAPAPSLDPLARRRLLDVAVAGARAIRYANAGTLEFLVDAGGACYFLEMNTRLQVEHAVSEALTGLDLVVAQLRIAAGDVLPWSQQDIREHGAAIEARIYAEDPSKQFMPSPGTIDRLELPSGDGIRVECGVAAGTAVTVHYDPLLMKIIAAGSSRDQALLRLDGALDRLVIEGVRTTRSFARRVLAHQAFRAGVVHTGMVDEGGFNG